MPLEISLQTPESRIRLPDIYPRENTADSIFLDRDINNPHFVVVRCLDDDTGGAVFRFPLETGLFAPDFSTLPSPKLNIETTIGPMGYYERPVTTKQTIGRLVIRHYYNQ